MNPGERMALQVDRTLGSMDGDFERVVYLASLRDAYRGRYLHEGLASLATADAVHQALHARHCAAFTAASALPLDSLCQQLQEHFAGLGTEPQQTAKMWLELEPFRDVFPTGCTELEREFFLSQMRAALKVIAASLRLGVPQAPGAWQRR